eukprot:TRINITY_DN7117_c0_g1_i2.p1 TRINITY_DN7117_c0_g1~~TRINITY_DN7117_c0_g1_i2.p1  ORF type:complete len:958 (+),score=170.30 TRINITY_DN7117_c0_g1_i2:287-2875(+)
MNVGAKGIMDISTEVPAAASQEELNVMEKKFNLPNETLVATYPAAYWLKFPRTGIMYISGNYVAFSSPMMTGANLLVPFREITKISKTEAQVDVHTAKQVHTFGVLFNTQEIDTLLHQLWKRAMDNMGKSANFVKKESEKRRYKDDSINLDTQGEYSSVQSKEEMQAITRNENFCQLFQLPLTETLFHEFPVTQLCYLPLANENGRGNVTVVTRGGNLYLSTSFLCFHSRIAMHDHSENESEHLTFIIPLKEIKKAKKSKKTPTGYFVSSLGIVSDELLLFTTTSAFRFLVVNRETVFAKIVECCKEFRKQSTERELGVSPAILNNFGSSMAHRFDGHVLSNKSQFSEDFYERNIKIAKKFNKYFLKFGSSLVMARSPSLLRLIQTGIPLWMKGYMWQFISNSFAFQLTHEKNYYESLVNKQHQSWLDISKFADGTKRDEVTRVLDEIERDLHRSLPKQSYFMIESENGEVVTESEGISKLRRVLHAFAAHNPEIGYCQSMNIIVASLLLFVGEEEAFYLLCSIIQKVPDYYEKNMLGSIVDINLFGQLIERHLNPVWLNLKKSRVEISLIALPWFLTLFIGYVPWEVSLRILDCFLSEGPNILLQVGLAVLKIHSEDLLKASDIVSVTGVLSSKAQLDVEILCKYAFEEFTLDYEEINRLRTFHRYKAIQELQQRNKVQMMHYLRKTVHFTIPQLETMYKDFTDNLTIDCTDHCLSMDQFLKLFFRHVAFWPNSVKSPLNNRRLFILFAYPQNRALSFTQYISSLDKILRGVQSDHQQLVFDLYSDGFNSKTISRQNFSIGLQLYLTLQYNTNNWFSIYIPMDLTQKLFPAKTSRSDFNCTLPSNITPTPKPLRDSENPNT